jgi:hypothetical protein
MKLRQVLGITAVSLLIGVLPAPAAGAMARSYINLTPNPVYVNEDVTITGICYGPNDGLVRSDGFVSPIRIGERGKVVGTPGTYTAMIKCPGTNYALADFTVLERPQSMTVLSKEIKPGGPVTLVAYCKGGEKSQVTSPGLVAPIVLTFAEATGQARASGKAVDRPGRYTATFECKGHAVKTTFTILGDNGANPRPAPQVVVKPKGAPQTGGGFLAGT